MHIHLIERRWHEMRHIEQIGVELGDGLWDVGEGPRAAGLEVVQQIVQDGHEVRLQEVKQTLILKVFL